MAKKAGARDGSESRGTADKSEMPEHLSSVPKPGFIPRGIAPRRALPHGKRIFDLNLSDRIEGVWDENIPLVQQTVIEGTDVSARVLSSWDELQARCEVICTTFQLSVLSSHHHNFQPGITAVFVLSESHLALHSWPEKGYINLDVMTCTRRGVDPVRLADLFAEIFEPSSLRCHRITF